MGAVSLAELGCGFETRYTAAQTPSGRKWWEADITVAST
jgi:O-methyltransferase involved in polyketide biosynthesis